MSMFNVNVQCKCPTSSWTMNKPKDEIPACFDYKKKHVNKAKLNINMRHYQLIEIFEKIRMLITMPNP